jgi:hypothetical protein
MALVECPECKAQVSSDAKSCPKCGKWLSGSGGGCLVAFAVAFGVGILLVVAVAISGGGSGVARTPSAPVDERRLAQTACREFVRGELHDPAGASFDDTAGYFATDNGGTWTGKGIITSAGQTNARTAIGYAEASVLRRLSGSATGTFDGQTGVVDDQVVARQVCPIRTAYTSPKNGGAKAGTSRDVKRRAFDEPERARARRAHVRRRSSCA